MSSFYVDSYQEAEKQKTEYIYNGSQLYVRMEYTLL
jgi:hypothetical protein